MGSFKGVLRGLNGVHKRIPEVSGSECLCYAQNPKPRNATLKPQTFTLLAAGLSHARQEAQGGIVRIPTM